MGKSSARMDRFMGGRSVTKCNLCKPESLTQILVLAVTCLHARRCYNRRVSDPLIRFTRERWNRILAALESDPPRGETHAQVEADALRIAAREADITEAEIRAHLSTSRKDIRDRTNKFELWVHHASMRFDAAIRKGLSLGPRGC